MTATLLLLVQGTFLAAAGGPLLRRATWPQRAPRLGVAVWLTLSGVALTSVFFAGLTLTLPRVPLTSDLATFVHLCLDEIRAQYSTPAGASSAVVGAAIMFGVAGRLVLCSARVARWRAAERARHAAALRLVGRREAVLGAAVVDHDVPLAYCLPGRGRQIVLTTAALERLSRPQLAAVLAHERAHLRSRHDLLIAAALVLKHAFPWVPAFAHAHEHVCCLVEMAADDAALRTHDRLTLAEGILRVAAGRPAAPALGAGSSSGARVRRLIAPRQRLGAARGLLVAAAVAGPLLTMAWLAAAPASAAAHVVTCPLPAATVLP
ncbi:M56 family metallopeptidase [Jiangella alba]|uniref:Signal transducer regulating beta-lactamase production, contains metallopeptidase domain n=1 Tax=Jiangella alba TaxID=561176 RepID=A0A1H5Q0D0_9ACTN|nr:M56 family metallopeptidase [Jiangella alba]SEF18901.1 Signal transducer regulating beta-lactamase production, contains metallopeptidase domain [Jiangella alba]